MNVSATAFSLRELNANHSVKLFVYLERFLFSFSQTEFRLTKNEEVKNLLAVCLNDNCAVVEISLLLLGLLSQNVTVVSVLTLNLSCASKLETLLGS